VGRRERLVRELRETKQQADNNIRQFLGRSQQRRLGWTELTPLARSWPPATFGERAAPTPRCQLASLTPYHPPRPASTHLLSYGRLMEIARKIIDSAPDALLGGVSHVRLPDARRVSVGASADQVAAQAVVAELQAMLHLQRRKTVRNPEVEELIATLLYYFAPVARIVEHIVGHAPAAVAIARANRCGGGARPRPRPTLARRRSSKWQRQRPRRYRCPPRSTSV
jgi:hypothetical protein